MGIWIQTLSFSPQRRKKGAVNLLGTSNKGQLGDVVVADVNCNLLSSRLAVTHANLDACFHIIVRDLNAGGENVPVPVVLNGGSGLDGLSS